MRDARARILARLDEAQSAVATREATPPVRRFAWGQYERLVRFQDRLQAVCGQVHRVSAGWPGFLHDLLHARGVQNLLFGPGGAHGAVLQDSWPVGDAIRLRPYVEPVETCRDALFDRCEAGFSACRGAVAETGTLALWPDADEPRLLSLVPPIHVVLLDASAIYSTFAELMDAQGWADAMPTNALLITGPSKSADIEQTLTYGVHGPKELIVLVREG